jgi:hypothetical protein
MSNLTKMTEKELAAMVMDVRNEIERRKPRMSFSFSEKSKLDGREETAKALARIYEKVSSSLQSAATELADAEYSADPFDAVGA